MSIFESTAFGESRVPSTAEILPKQYKIGGVTVTLIEPHAGEWKIDTSYPETGAAGLRKMAIKIIRAELDKKCNYGSRESDEEASLILHSDAAIAFNGKDIIIRKTIEETLDDLQRNLTTEDKLQKKSSQNQKDEKLRNAHGSEQYGLRLHQEAERRVGPALDAALKFIRYKYSEAEVSEEDIDKAREAGIEAEANRARQANRG